MLVHANTVRCPELRHEVPAAVGDPFLYGEREGRPFAVVSTVDESAVRAARPGIEILDPFAFGLNELLDVDLWPQDHASGCWADMTRTFVVGEPPDAVVQWHGLCRDALARAVDALAPGVTGRALWEVACDVFEAAVAGDVVALEPGTGRHDVGGVRIEDLFLVTADGAERLTPFSDEPDPRAAAQTAA